MSRLIRLRVRPGFVVNHRDPKNAGSSLVDWRKLEPGDRFRATEKDAKRLIEEGVASLARGRWRR